MKQLFSRRPLFSLVLLCQVFLWSACKKDDNKPPSVPELGATLPASNILETSATSGGKIVYDGGSAITARGVCFGTQPNPTVNSGLPNSGTTVDGTGSGTFSSTLNGLVPNTLYYVRSYAVNGLGIGYGSEISFVSNFPPPVLTTGTVTQLGLKGNSQGYEATLSVTISNLNGGKVIRKGLLWSAYNPNPTLDDQDGVGFDTVSVGPGDYSVVVSNITRGKEVYLRPFVTSRIGSKESTGYGNPITIETFVKDIDNNLYNFATIGNQTWLTENLRVRRLNDGSVSIPVSESGSQWMEENVAKRMICSYPGGELANVDRFGLLYNFKTVESGKVCPVGWHVPSREELNSLKAFVGGDGNANKLKATTGWGSSNGNNSSGFNALPAGYISSSGSPMEFSPKLAQIHSSTLNPFDSDKSYNMLLWQSSDNIQIYDYSIREGSSIRCVKN